MTRKKIKEKEKKDTIRPENDSVVMGFAIPSYEGYDLWARCYYENRGGKHYFLPDDFRVPFRLDTSKMSMAAKEFLRLGWWDMYFVSLTEQEKFDSLTAEEQKAFDRTFYPPSYRVAYEVAYYDIICRIHRGESPQLGIENFIGKMRNYGWIGFCKGNYRRDNAKIFRFTDENTFHMISAEDNKRYVAQATKEYDDWLKNNFESENYPPVPED